MLGVVASRIPAGGKTRLPPLLRARDAEESLLRLARLRAVPVSLWLVDVLAARSSLLVLGPLALETETLEGPRVVPSGGCRASCCI